METSLDLSSLIPDIGDLTVKLPNNSVQQVGGSGNRVINGTSGTDVINAGSGNDRIDGGGGNDVINAGGGNDTIFGGAGNDVINAGNGNNIVDGSSGNDVINTGNGRDSLVGGTGNDIINAGGGEDRLFGGDGNDVLNGGAGKDVLNGGAGNDTLAGGSGNDVLTGGSGNDVFKFTSVSDSPASSPRDVISDFFGNGNLPGDVIDLSDIDANSTIGGNQTFTFIGAAAFTVAGQVRYSGGILQANTDGNLSANLEVRVTGAPSIVVSDIVL
jgi:serralysin